MAPPPQIPDVWDYRMRLLPFGTDLALTHGCELLVLLSRMEPFGIVRLEAMACKRSVVAYAVDAIP